MDNQIAQAKQPQLRNIFEVINQNIVELSQDFVELYQKVDAIHKALYPIEEEITEPNTAGAESQQ
jgi:uncharacterized coiled-coil DUF342 family protein